MKKTKFLHFLFWILFLLIHWNLSGSQDSFFFFIVYYIAMMSFCIGSFYAHYYLISFLKDKYSFTVFKLIFYSLLSIVLNSVLFELIVHLDTLIKRNFGFEVQLDPLSIHELILNITLFTFITICSSFYYLIVEYIKQKEKLKTLKIQSIQSQVNPHFINNELQNLYLFIEGNNKEDGLKYLENLAAVLDYNVIANKQDEILVKEEIFFLINYLDIISDQWNIEDKITYSIKGDLSMELRIFPLILIYFVENAIKHSGVVNHDTKVNVLIQIKQDGIKLNVENTIPKTLNNKIKSTKIGIDNAKNLLNYHYPNKHQLVIDKSPNGFNVNLEISLL